jgi:Zn finger protein HypA/HybF involved in hydrogenase expression
MVNKTKVKEFKIETITVQVFNCTRCKYRWVPEFKFDHWKTDKTDGETNKPVACPHCHSPYYDKQRKESNNGKE